jgi:hypothetical protein
MNISRKLAGWSLFFIFVASGSLRAQGRNLQETPESCRQSMQRFYNQLVGKGPKYPRAVLSPELRWLLKDDAHNKMDENGLIQGLDYDPIANGQDICERYVAGKVTRKGNRYLVEITCLWGNKKSADNSMRHEVRFSRGRWMIMNIHYSYYEKGKLTGHADLLSILKKSRADRLKNSKPSRA